MVVAVSKSSTLGAAIERHSQASAADTAQTVAVAGAKRLLMVVVKYSAAPTQAGVTTTLNSGAGAAYDAVLDTGSADAQTTVYLPAVELPFLDDDSIDVAAPAAGGVITSTIAVYTRPIEG